MEQMKEFISDLADILQNKNLGEIETEIDGNKIRIKAREHSHYMESSISTAPRATEHAPQVEAVETAPCGILIKAPIVGTFYGASSPEAQPFIKVGDRVEQGQTLFILEAMKTMNEITSTHSGVVREILAQNGDMLEYGAVAVVLD